MYFLDVMSFISFQIGEKMSNTVLKEAYEENMKEKQKVKKNAF